MLHVHIKQRSQQSDIDCFIYGIVIVISVIFIIHICVVKIFPPDNVRMHGCNTGLVLVVSGHGYYNGVCVLSSQQSLVWTGVHLQLHL